MTSDLMENVPRDDKQSPPNIAASQETRPQLPPLAHLRPTTALELLDRAAAVLRARPRLFFWLAVQYVVPVLVVCAGYYWLHAPSESKELSQGFLAWLFAALLLAEWANAAVIASCFQLLLFPSRPLRLWVALRGALGRLPYLALTRFFVVVILSMGLSVPAQLLAGAPPGGGSLDALTAVLVLWILFLSIYFMVLWMLTPVIVMIERHSFLSAMMRSMELMRLQFGSGWLGDSAVRRLGLILLLPASLWLLQTAAAQGAHLAATGSVAAPALFVPPTYQAMVTLAAVKAPSAVFAVTAVTAALMWFVVGLWLYAGLVLLYAECRMRREALDIQVRLLARGETAIPDSELAGL